MGRLKTEIPEVPPLVLASVAHARSYTLYERGSTWYVNFVVAGRQVRVSTGCRSFDAAKALIESHRPQVARERFKIAGVHLERMLERARARSKKKRLDFALNRESMRALEARCNGCCEITGHPLEMTGPFRPSLDRIDCAKGYTPDNVRIVCLITNTAMLHYGEAAFMELAIAVCRHRNLLTPAD